MAKHSSVTLKSTRGRFLPSPASSLLASQIESVLFKRGYSRDGNEESAQTRKTTWRKKSRRSPVLVDDRWTIVNADDMLPGQGRSFLIPNYIRDVSMKVTRRTNDPCSTIDEMVFLYPRHSSTSFLSPRAMIVENWGKQFTDRVEI